MKYNSPRMAALCADDGVLLVGLFFVVPCTDSFVRVDLRTVSFDIPPQEVCLSSSHDLGINLTTAIHLSVSQSALASRNFRLL